MLSLFVDSVSSEEVISDDVSSVSELVVVLVSGEMGEDSCNGSSCTGTLCSTSMVICSLLIAVRCASIWLRLVVVTHVEFCSGGLGRNLRHGTGIGFVVDGLEMVVFSFRSDCVVADGPGMVEFMWESGCSSVADGIRMGVCNGHMCWQLWC